MKGTFAASWTRPVRGSAVKCSWPNTNATTFDVWGWRNLVDVIAATNISTRRRTLQGRSPGFSAGESRLERVERAHLVALVFSR